MSYDVIRKIIQDRELNVEAKLSIINKVLDDLEGLDEMAAGLAEDGKNSYEIIGEIADHEKVNLNGMSTVQKITEEGVKWLKAKKNKDGGWGMWEENMYRQEDVKKVKDKTQTWPNDMSSPWETATANAVLRRWRIHFDHEKKLSDDEKSGLLWLQNNQNDDGGWAELPKEYGSESELLDTGFSICSFVEDNKVITEETINGVEVIKKGINFLLNSQNEDGGWPLYHNNSETKPTALSVLVINIMKPFIEKYSWLNEKVEEIEASHSKGVRWLLDNQDKGGQWKTRCEAHPSNTIDPTFYAMYALKSWSLFVKRSDPELFNKIYKATKKSEKAYKDNCKIVSMGHQTGLHWRGEKSEGGIENTAAAITVLLDCGTPEHSLFVTKGIEWLLKQQGRVGEYWGSDTDIVLYCFITLLRPGLRMVRRPFAAF